MEVSEGSGLTLNSRTLANLRKTTCRRYAAMAFAHVDAQSLAKRIGLDSPPVDRGAAYEFGSRFEEFLMRDDAKRLVSALRNSGLVSASVAVVNFGGRVKNGDRVAAYHRLGEFLGQRRLEPVGEVLLIGATLPFPSVDEVTFLLPDALLLRDGSSHPVPIEIKAYEERGVLSPQESIDSAAAQCGLYSLALQRHPEFLVSRSDVGADEAILVFRDPGKRRGSAFKIDVSRARALAVAALEMVPSDEGAFVREFGFTSSEALANDRSLLSIEASYCDSCSTVCPLFLSCANDAESSSRALGDSFTKLVGVRPLREIEVAVMSGPIGEDDVGLQLLADGLRELERV